MASSFVKYKGYGFWASDSLLQIWLYFLTKQINATEHNDAWLEEAGKTWVIQAKGVCTGCIYVGLDNFITTPEQENSLIHISQVAIEALQENGSFLRKEDLNRPELGTELGTAWTVNIAISDVKQVAQQFIKLLQGKLQSTAATTTTIDPLQSTQQFLQDYCADADTQEELVNHLELQAAFNAKPLVQGLKSLAQLLVQPPPDDKLLQLVTQDANITLIPPTPENAKEWLSWLIQQIQRELQENILPFQPMRAKLTRIVEPENGRFPHDLLLYPTDEPKPEFWSEKWSKQNIFYKAFIDEWDEETCPTCHTPTITIRYKKKFAREWAKGPYNSTLYYDKYIVYTCTICQLGWTEKDGSTHHTEVEYPG